MMAAELGADTIVACEVSEVNIFFFKKKKYCKKHIRSRLILILQLKKKKTDV